MRRMRRKDNAEELAMPSPIEEIIPEMSRGDQPLSSSALAELSNLSPDELALFRQAWTDIEPQRRREIVSRLVELAEDDFELNFDSIFRFSIEAANSAILNRTLGTIDVTGRSTASFHLPLGLSPTFVGLPMDFAYGTWNPTLAFALSSVSNPVRITLGH